MCPRADRARARTDQDALVAFQAAERFADYLNALHPLVTLVRAALVYVTVRLGDTEGAEEALAGLDEHVRDHAEGRIAAAALRLAQGNPRAATGVLEPVLDGSDPVLRGPGKCRRFCWRRSLVTRWATRRPPRALERA